MSPFLIFFFFCLFLGFAVVVPPSPPPPILKSNACIEGTFQGLTVPLTCAGRVANLTLSSVY